MKNSIDWTGLIFELMKTGLSGAQIARKIGCFPTTLNTLKNGGTKQPLYSTGAALINLHRKYKDAGLIRNADKKLG